MLKNEKPGAASVHLLPALIGVDEFQPANPWQSCAPRRARLCFTPAAPRMRIKWSCQSSVLQRTANRVLTICLTQGGNPKSIRNPKSVKGQGSLDLSQ